MVEFKAARLATIATEEGEPRWLTSREVNMTLPGWLSALRLARSEAAAAAAAAAAAEAEFEFESESESEREPTKRGLLIKATLRQVNLLRNQQHQE